MNQHDAAMFLLLGLNVAFWIFALFVAFRGMYEEVTGKKEF